MSLRLVRTDEGGPVRDQERPPQGVGSEFNGWLLEREIAKGGMSTVFLARHQLVGRRAAIKVIRPPAGTRADETTVERFLNEATIQSSLRHPNIPEFYDARLYPDGTAVLALEYLDGRDLADALRYLGRLPLGDALTVVVEVLRPLQVMHAQSVHRDIKPSNIFIRRRPRFDSEGRLEKGRVTVLDFGIAKVHLRPGPTREHTIVGTQCYMSPEQMRGEPLDGRSDLYAVGIVLYEMLGGHPLFVPDPKNVPSFAVLMDQHFNRAAPDLRDEVADLPDDVWAFIARLLEKEREHRFDNALDASQVATGLLDRYRQTAKLFRDDVDDLVAAMEALRESGWAGQAARPPTNPMQTEPSISVAFATTDEQRREAPVSVGTPEQRILEWIGLHACAPRVFLSPALERIHPKTGEIDEVFELSERATTIGTAPGAAIRLYDAGLASYQARLTLDQNRCLVVERMPPSITEERTGSSSVLQVGGADVGSSRQVVHGERLQMGKGHFRIIDRALEGPTGPAAPLVIQCVDLARDRAIVANCSLTDRITVGSMTGCDLVVPSMPEVRAVLWLRADGNVEIDWIDLRQEDPVIGGRLAASNSFIPMGSHHELRVLSLGDAQQLAHAASPREDERSDVAAHSPPRRGVSRVTAPLPPEIVQRVASGSWQVRFVPVEGDASLQMPPPVVVTTASVVIGREPEMADVVIAIPTVSARHAKITRIAPGVFQVLDLDSTHGVLVNGTRVKEAVLRSGDVIHLANACITPHEDLPGLNTPGRRE